jgi:type I restriction enzyme R subunit
MKATTELAFEAYIQETMSEKRGWVAGDVRCWDQKNALFPEYTIDYIKKTQPDLWSTMEREHGEDFRSKLLESLIKERSAKGTLHILRHGFKFYGKNFKIAQFKPAHGLGYEAMELYVANVLHVTRQVLCHPHDRCTADMVLSLNGIPVATLELKNPTTNQTWRNAVHQYETDRDPRAPLFEFKKGAIVHFAVDPDEVHMTTRLNGGNTLFLPFNRGSHPGEIRCGAGNPQHPSGHRTGYLWEDVFARDSFIDILGSFMFVETTERIVEDEQGKRNTIVEEAMIFPRFHQLDSVRALVNAARVEGAGNNYLIQHSAGSGKTNSISWLSHRLSNLHTSSDQKVFDCIVVVTDRIVLDRQLQDAIYQIEHAQGVVKAIDEDAIQLAKASVDGTKIVVTTLQKFPRILAALLRIASPDKAHREDEETKKKSDEWQALIASRRYAVIVDEAHSSQSGETARELKRILGIGNRDGDDDDHDDNGADEDWQEGLCQVMASRRRQKNLSFFAFTATPKGKTLELFGRVGKTGKKEAFHIYSMRQAIQERFILDVLQRYTTYKTYFGLLKAASEDPKMPKKKAMKKLAKYIALHPHNVEQKTEIIIEHFRQQVRNKMRGRAKAMVVTGSRLSAVRYMESFTHYINEKGYKNIRPLVAFSGKVKDPDTGKEYTEPSMNIDVVSGKYISEKQLPDKFDTSDYNILLVANKYQTGFDQPLLCAMYVDKRLDGVQAVQTLSRLNRVSSGKEEPFVLDFVNEASDIKEAFGPYYDGTILDAPSDPNHLELLKHEMDAMQVYHWSEVEAFAHIFYIAPEKQIPSDHARMEKEVQPAVDRFKELKQPDKVKFYEKLTAYVKFYSFVSQIIPYSDAELEMLYSFGRHLIPRIDPDDQTKNPHPEKDVALQYYRLEKTSSDPIILDSGDIVGVKSPTAVGTSKALDENKPLSEIINRLNERYGAEFTEEDRLLLEQIKEKASNDERVIQTAQNNPLERFELGIRQLIETLMMQRMSENDAFVSRYMDESEFQDTIFPLLAKAIYRDVNAKSA